MHLAQTADTVGIAISDTNYTFIQDELKPSYYVTSAIVILLGLAGVASFIYLLWGGIQWITAGGDKDAIDKARRKVIGALIGLAIVFSGYAIMYILRVLFNVNIIGFNLSQLGT